MSSSSIQTLWQELHAQQRFQPLYPHEAVVRFLMTQFPRDETARRALRILDLGCGAGRHTLLFGEQGFTVFGADFSLPGLNVTANRVHARGLDAPLVRAMMQRLPVADAALDGVVAFGVLYYNGWQGAQDTVRELWRVLKPGGKAQVVTRSTRDYRYGKGQPVDRSTFILEIDETNERDMPMVFFTREDVRELFRDFSQLTADLMETTIEETGRIDSDWIITVLK